MSNSSTDPPHQPYLAYPPSISELLLVVLAAAALTTAITYPLAFHPASLGRVNLDDARFSIWNVAWVARTLVVDPRHLFDANIFYPHRSALAYSESNLGAGLLALPAYWTTRNPYLAHNVVMFLAFVLTATGMYALVRYLTHDRRAAAIAAICFAFCPFVLAHTASIQLLMDAGVPFSMLAFHRLADRPTIGRGATLGVAMAAQAISCGYYAVFLALMIGYAVVVVAWSRARWNDSRYWMAIGAGALVAIAIVAPLFIPYARLQRSGAIDRPLADAMRWSADWRAYLASPSFAHAWMLRLIGHWNDALFPGLIATAGGLGGLWVTVRRRQHELLVLYGGLAVLGCWTSFGPQAGLYSVFYRTLPVFSLLHAPSRIALIVAFAVSVLAGVGLAAGLARLRHGSLVGVAVAIAAASELAVRIDFRPVPEVTPAYRQLATLPPGPLVEMPFFERRLFYPRHTVYMLASTAHWMPLVNGYSDYIPDDFRRDALALAPFPFPSAFAVLQRDGVRYAMVHLNVYDAKTRAEVEGRLDEFARYLRPLYSDSDTRLYEIIGFPP